MGRRVYAPDPSPPPPHANAGLLLGNPTLQQNGKSAGHRQHMIPCPTPHPPFSLPDIACTPNKKKNVQRKMGFICYRYGTSQNTLTHGTPAIKTIPPLNKIPHDTVCCCTADCNSRNRMYTHIYIYVYVKKHARYNVCVDGWSPLETGTTTTISERVRACFLRFFRQSYTRWNQAQQRQHFWLLCAVVAPLEYHSTYLSPWDWDAMVSKRIPRTMITYTLTNSSGYHN